MKSKKTLLLALATTALLVSCGKDDKPVEDKVELASHLDLSDFKSYIAADLDNAYSSIHLSDATLKANVKAAYDAGKAAINGAETKTAVSKAFADAKKAMADCIPLADGLYDYTGLDTAGKTEVLGLLEAYAVNNGITGISLFEDGAYVMYSDRVKLGTENYVIGYGFGVLTDGSIVKDNDTEENANWKRYYHSLDSSDPGTANYLNDQGEQVGDYYGYDHCGFYTTFLNSTKDGYIWVPELASTMPEMVGAAAGATSNAKWRFEVKVGSEVKYNTNSTKTDRAAFKNREVALEDYLTPFKLLLDAKNELYRGSELANSKSGAIKGAKEYYEATKQGTAASFDNVGLKAYTEGGKNYFEVEFTTPCDSFNAMYYITSSLYQPIPQSFIDLVGLKNYLGFDSTKSTSPVDNSLSLGAYTLERWDTEQQIVYKKNPNYVFAATKYQIPGVHIHILTAAKTDSEAGFKEFLAGKTDSTGIPQTQLDAYKNDPRTKQTIGTSNFKLNVNATSPETWNYLFGEDGVVTQTPASKAWDVKPCLSNSHFIKGLSLAINRDEFGAARGSVGSVNYFSPNYMASSETELKHGADYDYLEVTQEAYNNTNEHKAAVANLLKDTDNGFNLELSREYFKLALDELEAAGKYVPGTKENPTQINLEIGWQYPQHEENYHNEIKQYLETAFNDETVTGGRYKLNVNFWVGTEWSDIYYNKMMLGQFDIGFGSISGDSLNPLNFMNVLSTDQTISSGFTLNWGTDTNDPLADALVYNDLRWSYDALYMAANVGAIVSKGAYTEAYSLAVESHELAGNTWTDKVTAQENASFVDVDLSDLVIFSRSFDFDGATGVWDYAAAGAYADQSSTYLEVSVADIEGATITIGEKVNGKTTVTVTIPKNIADLFKGVAGYDVYGSVTIDGKVSVDDNYMNSVYCTFVEASEE